MTREGLKMAFSPGFLKPLMETAIPVTLVTLIMSSRAIVDIVMTANLGTDEVAAMGLAAKVSFIVIVVLMGLANGGAVFITQFFGASEPEKVKQATAITLILSLFLGVIFYAGCYFGVSYIIGSATDSETVLKHGVDYFVIASATAIPLAVAITASAGLRSIDLAKDTLGFIVLGALLNYLLNYLLIFGNWGFPALGIRGAAWATLISSSIEALALTTYIYRKVPALRIAVADLKLGIKSGLGVRILTVSVPLILNTALWSVGVLIYSIIFGRLGTLELASLTLITPIEYICMAFYSGVATGASVLIGQSLGAKKFDDTWQQAQGVLIIVSLTAFFTLTIIWVLKDFIFGLYSEIDIQTLSVAKSIIGILLITMAFRAYNIAVIVGMLRSGGDTKFCLFMDIICQLIGIVIAFCAAFIWQLSFTWVFFAICIEELLKIIFTNYRMYGKKWIVNLTLNEDSLKPS